MAVFLLIHEEQVRLDPGQLAEMYLECGEEGAEQVLGDAVEDIALSLARLARIGPHGSLTEIADLALGLSRNAARCGMVDLARVGRDVSSAAAQIDLAALGATLARLGRVGERSLAMIWGPCNASL